MNDCSTTKLRCDVRYSLCISSDSDLTSRPTLTTSSAQLYSCPQRLISVAPDPPKRSNGWPVGCSESVCEPPQQGNTKQYEYDLQGVVSHMGSSMYSGHYVSDVFDQDNGKWYNYNDSYVEEVYAKTMIMGVLKCVCCQINVKKLLSGKQEAAYLIFFLRRDLKPVSTRHKLDGHAAFSTTNKPLSTSKHFASRSPQQSAKQHSWMDSVPATVKNSDQASPQPSSQKQIAHHSGALDGL